jgi:predicted cupin superfamily sugar epimerase
MMAKQAELLVNKLALEPHPEGGHFREIYRSEMRVMRAGQERSAMTSVYYLLAAGEHSRWHVVASDEVWHFYEGFPLELLVFDPETEHLDTVLLGLAEAPGQKRVHCVPAGSWQAARTLGDFSLVGCDVAPGFEFDDFLFVADLPLSDEVFAKELAGFSNLL